MALLHFTLMKEARKKYIVSIKRQCEEHTARLKKKIANAAKRRMKFCKALAGTSLPSSPHISLWGYHTEQSLIYIIR